MARICLFFAFSEKSLVLFVIEVFIEGIATCFSSGTQSAYIYTVTGEDEFVVKSAHVGNFGTAGFIISTISYAAIYSFFDIPGLLIATICSSAIGAAVSFGLTKEQFQKEKEEEAVLKVTALGKNILNIKTFVIIIFLSCISIAFILINFFYVDKLQTCNISEEFLTPIILGYSLIQLLAEKILDKIDKNKYSVTFIVLFLVAGCCMIIFGNTSNLIAVIIFMLILPLLIDLPAYILDELQNSYIDKISQTDKRAELLSIFNMGVNLVEIIFLFASALVANIGISICFGVLGISMIVLCLISFRVLKRM